MRVISRSQRPRLVAALVVGALFAAASTAAAKAQRHVPLYIRVTLAERYFSTQADGSSWQSQAYVDADYRVVAKPQDVGPITVSPTIEYGDFRAELNGRGQDGATDCAWKGLPIRSAEAIQILGPPETPKQFAINIEAPWPDSPTAWTQIRTQASTAQCPTGFGLNPLEGVPPDGETTWVPENTLFGTDLNLHFYHAISEQIAGYLEERSTADAQPVTMLSRTEYSDGEKYTVEAWGTIVQSHVPITGAPENNLLLVPDQSTAPLPSMSALEAQGLRELRKVPTGCVVGHHVGRRHRCP